MPILIASPLLRTLSTLQATLDSLDIEGVNSQLNLHLEDDSKPPSPVLASQPALEEWMAWLAARSEAGQGGSTSTKERELLLSYLLSATFKDCSIFIRLAPSAQDDGGTDKPSCSVSVKAIDLDPKLLARLPQYFEQDRNIWSSWKAMLEQRSAEGGGEVRKCVV